MLNELVVATGNSGKLRELKALVGDIVPNVLSLADFPQVPPAVEDGCSFVENAIKKGKHAVLATGKPALADDSGLVVPALDGRPGIYSARYAGLDADDAANNRKLLREMAGLSDDKRHAYFQCVIAVCFPDGDCRTFSGELHGVIIETGRGDEGFGYDPLFLIPELAKTLAELPLEVKNRISHRALALKEMLLWLRSR